MRATIYSIRVRNAAPAARCSRLRRLQGEAVAQTVVRDIGYGRDREPAPSKLLLRFLTVRWPPRERDVLVYSIEENRWLRTPEAADACV
jgi:hypothetical protein